MSDTPPPIRGAEFQAVDTVVEEEVLRRCSGTVRSLHSFLNQLPCLRDLQKARLRWKSRVGEKQAFGNIAADPNHWYTFHHGGRNECQFNVGLREEYLRIGMGFEFSQKKGGDPTIVQLVYSSFLYTIRGDLEAFRRFVSAHGLEIEWCEPPGPPVEIVRTESVVDWLVAPPREPLWIFVGKLLRRHKDAELLACAGVYENIFTGFRPWWEQTQMTAAISK
jgi:hypothetical protein